MTPHRRAVMGRMCLSRRRALRLMGCVHGFDIVSPWCIDGHANRDRIYVYYHRVFPPRQSTSDPFGGQDGGMRQYDTRQDFDGGLLLVAYPLSQMTVLFDWWPPSCSGPYQKIDRHPDTPTRPRGMV